MKKILVHLGILLSLGLNIPGNANATEVADKAFDQGISAFKKQNYKEALQGFLQSWKAGNKTAQLYYNLGVCYYKLGQYGESKRYFNYLTKDKNLHQLAYYNLGLIAAKQNQTQTAINYFYQASDAKGDEKITALANRMLDQLEKDKPRRNTTKTTAGVSLAIGYDDNVTLVSSGSPTSQGDAYLEGFAYLNLPLNQQWQFHANVLWINYQDVNAGDFRYLSGDIRYTTYAGNWKLTPSIGVSQGNLNGTSYQQIVDVRVTADKQLDKDASLRLRYRYSDITSQNVLYDYLQGSRQQVRIEYKDQTGLGQLRLRYELETNDRQNTLTQNYSPTRHTLRARLKHRLSTLWGLSEEISLRSSDYDAVAGVSRSDDQLRLRVIATHKLDRDWDMGFKYSYTDNSSNIAVESYTRNDLQIFTDYRF